MALNPGKFDKRIIIQQNTGTQDADTGQQNETWTTFATIWGEIKPVTGKEPFISQQFEAKVTTKINAWYLAGVTPKMRVLFGSRILQIEAVLNWNEACVDMTLLCSEVQA